jgi:hypothetical protein
MVELNKYGNSILKQYKNVPFSVIRSGSSTNIDEFIESPSHSTTKLIFGLKRIDRPHSLLLGKIVAITLLASDAI